MRNMHERYDLFSVLCVPEELPPYIKTLVQHAFFAGALETLSAFSEMGKMPDEQRRAEIVKLSNEVIDFGARFCEQQRAKIQREE